MNLHPVDLDKMISNGATSKEIGYALIRGNRDYCCGCNCQWCPFAYKEVKDKKTRIALIKAQQHLISVL